MGERFGAEQQDFAGEAVERKQPDSLRHVGTGTRAAEHDEIGHDGAQRSAELPLVRAIVGGEPELLERFAQEFSNVLLAVDDTDPRRDFSPAECCMCLQMPKIAHAQIGDCYRCAGELTAIPRDQILLSQLNFATALTESI